jgi:hypothetical protein
MTKYLLVHAGAEFMEDIKKSTLNSVDLLSPISTKCIWNLSRKVLPRIAPILGKYWVRKYLYSSVKKPSIYEYVIIFDSNIWLDNLEEFKSYFINSKIIIWYWNVIKDVERLERVKDSGLKIFTFDDADSEKFGLNFGNQFHWIESDQVVDQIKYDVVYIGRSKNRLSEIEKIYLKCKDLNLRTFFYVVRDKKMQSSNVLTLVDEFMPYDQALDVVKKSQIIVDINSDLQSGMSLRPLEAMALKKKLITNCKACRKLYPYSNENLLYLNDALINDDNFKIFIKTKLNPSKMPNYLDFHIDTWLREIAN